MTSKKAKKKVRKYPRCSMDERLNTDPSRGWGHDTRSERSARRMIGRYGWDKYMTWLISHPPRRPVVSARIHWRDEWVPAGKLPRERHHRRIWDPKTVDYATMVEDGVTYWQWRVGKVVRTTSKPPTYRNLKLLHEDSYGKLWQFQVGRANEHIIRVVEVINATPGHPSHHFIPVHRALRPIRGDGYLGVSQPLKAKNAVASTFGMTGRSYRVAKAS